MKPTEHTANTASTPKNGLFATLRGLLPVQGSGALKTSRGTDAPARWLLLPVLALMLGVLAFTSAPALAAGPPETPETGKANPATITATTATLEDGVLNPHAAGEVGEYEYRFKVSATECEGGSRTAPELAPGAEKEAVPAVDLTSLQPDVEYSFCLVERNLGGESSASSPVEHFTTKLAPPAIEFETAYPKETEATLEAYVNANNQEVTKCDFQYGTDATLATSTTVECEPKTLPGLFGPQGVVVGLPGLQADQTYYFRAVAENAAHEKEAGAIAHFTTTPEAPEAVKPEHVTGTTATLKGVLNPKATLPGAEGSYEFLYRQSATECQGGEPGEEKKAPEPAGAAHGLAEEAVSAQVAGLLPDSQYTYCLLARNAAGRTALSVPVMFTTPIVQPIVEGESTSDVSAGEARLEASIDPGGLETSYRFEYGPAAGSYDASVPVTPREIAAGVKSVSVSGVATGLTPSTTYHYRILASNAQSPAGGTPGPDQTFTTLAAPSTTAGTCPNEQARAEQPYGLVLPDCRAYEMVSPLDKNGEGVEAVEARASVANGGAGEGAPAIAYLSPGSFSGPKGAEGASRYISRRETDGWSTQNVSPPAVAFGQLQPPFEQLLFTPELSQGLLAAFYVPLLEGEPAGYNNLYVANFTADSYQTATPDDIPGPPYQEEVNNPTSPAAVGASSDLSHVVFEQAANLTGQGGGIFEWVGGKLSFVSGGLVGALGITDSKGPWHAVSENGRRVVFSAEGVSGIQLYVRENPEQEQSPLNSHGECTEPAMACTVEASASQRTYPDSEMSDPDPNASKAPSAWYLDASADGERVFFTSRVELTTDAKTGAADNAANLYEYNLETKELTDLTVPTEAEETGGEDPAGAAVVGLVNAGQNAGEENSYVYFVANGVLAAGAKPGDCPVEASQTGKNEPDIGERTCSLYVEHYNNGKWEAPKFIATLAGNEGTSAGGTDKATGPVNDEGDWLGTEAVETEADYGPGYHTARVTPDGSTLAFASERSLTGYDNEQAQPGECEGSQASLQEGGPETGRCHEVYLYDAVTGRLVCASCGPSGARPAGPSALGGRETEEFSRPSPLYLPRNLSEDGGRLFFQSRNSLVPHASDGKLNVYEWEQPALAIEAAKGENSCTQAGGCVFGISDVAGAYGSKFMDATPNGNNVFIATQDQLVPADTDTRNDVYDVRVNGGFPVTPAATVCTNADSCKPPVSPQPGVFAAPASATFSGPGNPAPPPPPPAVVKPKLTKKTVKCRKPKKLTHGKCLKPKKKAHKAKKSAKGRK